MAAFNYADFIEEAINSVISQTFEDWELIVINDGSTDGTEEVLKHYKSNQKIRIIHQKNKGLNITNNIALRLARGEYVMRLDADDYLDENALSVLSDSLDRNHKFDLVFPDYFEVDENGKILDLIRRDKIDHDVEILDLPAHGACTMFRTNTLKRLGGYVEDFQCQDGYELWLRFIQKYKPKNINIPLFYYRQHSKSLTKNKKKILDTRREIKKRFVKKELNQKAPRVVAIIPAARNTNYIKNDALEDICGKPLVWYTISEALKCKSFDEVIITSSNDDVLDFAKDFDNITLHKRSVEIDDNSSRGEMGLDALKSLKNIDQKNIDYICFLNINSPLRTVEHMDWAINTLIIFNVDNVISVDEELNNLFLHGESGLYPVTDSNSIIKLERDTLYRENGAITLTHLENLLAEGSRTKTGHITLLPEESVRINSDFEFWLATKLLEEKSLTS
jgi:glycosyltransferase involved in cell wall biosynthesis